MPGLIDTAVSGLKLSQLSLNTAGQNIVNANTEGYSRQTVLSETQNPSFVGVGYVGSGVTVSGIIRNTEQYLIDQVNSDLSILGEFEQYLSNINQMDNLLADPSTSVSASIEDFFEALNGVANNPAGIESRQLLLNQTDLLLDRFEATETKIQNQNLSLNAQLETLARSVTTIGAQIAELNSSISTSPGLANGKVPNDLLDRRDILVRQLSQIVDVNTTVDQNYSMSVFIGEGLGLVIGPRPAQISVQPGNFDPSRAELAISVNGIPQVITDQLTGGEMGGVLRFRKEALEPSLNSLGRIAMAFTHSINQQQRLGVDLEGNLGRNIFTDINDPTLTVGRVLKNSKNALPADRQLSVRIDDLSRLTTSDYRVIFPGPGSRFSVVRSEDSQIVHQGILDNKFPHEVNIDGFTLSFDAGSFREGDSFILRPTGGGIDNVRVLATRPEAFAMASPITGSAGSGNRGGASIASMRVDSVSTPSFTDTPGQLSPPVLIRFNSPTNYDVLDFSDPANPVPLDPPLSNRSFVPGAVNAIFPDDVGGTTLSTDFATVARAQLGQGSNGYLEETLTITSLNAGGFARETVLRTEAGQSAASLAHQLSAIEGVTATALSQIQLYDFNSDGSDAPLNVLLNGVNLTSPELIEGRALPDPPDADFLRDSINASQELRNQGIVATSDGLTLTVRSSAGVDLRVDVEGNGGDSVSIRDGDLRSVIGRTNLAAGYSVSPNTSIDLDLGFGAVTVPLSPGAYPHTLVVSTLQADVNAALGNGVVRVSRNSEGNIYFEATDKNRVVSVTAVSGEDVLGVSPLVISGPDLGDQPAVLSGASSTVNPFDFSGSNGSFALNVNGVYTDTITLTQNYPINAGQAIAADINTQIAASNGPNGLAGQIQARVNSGGFIEFVTTAVGPSATVTLSAPIDMQNLLSIGTASGAQLTGTQAQVRGAVEIAGGADFNQGGPHNFMLGIDDNPPVQVSLTGTTALPAVFANTLDITAGVDFTGGPHGFDLAVAGYPLVTIDVSGVDTTLAPTPLTAAPQGLVDLFQERIDAQLGAGVITVGLNASNNVILTTVDAGVSTSITVSNPTGNVATGVYPVVGTAVGTDEGSAGALDLIRTRINAALSAAGQDPVQVNLDASGFLTIASSIYGSSSQVTVSDVNGGFGFVFPASDQGVRFNNSVTVGGTVDVMLAANTTVSSTRDNGIFGKDPEAVSNYMGYQVYLNSGQSGNGMPAAGDTFLIDFNNDAPGDNTNAGIMLALRDADVLADGNLGLLTAYSLVVEEVGILTSQARITQEASESLLRQSEAALQEVAGVNIDEEAASLIKFEQHYQASAQLISIARNLFDVILEL